MSRRTTSPTRSGLLFTSGSAPGSRSAAGTGLRQKETSGASTVSQVNRSRTTAIRSRAARANSSS